MRKNTELQRAAVLGAVQLAGGVVRSERLEREGHSRRLIGGLVADGSLVRIRRRWVATPLADAMAVTAARKGVVVTCVTEARRRGLWVLDAPEAHVAARSHAGHVDVEPCTIVHWAKPLVPRHPDTLFDPVENMLALVAHCQPFESALVIWESALNKRLVDPLVLGRLPLSGRARQLLQRATPFADSGLETLVRSRLAWLRQRIIAQAWIAGHRVDYLIGQRLALQIDGGTHVGAQREEDIRHDAELTLMGYHVIRVGYRQVLDDWPAVQDQIMRAVAQGLHRAA